MSEKQTVVPDPLAHERTDAQETAPLQLTDLVAVKLTDTGQVRPHNEDYVDYFVPSDPQQQARKGAIYLVADGMGGHQAGEVASRGVVDLVIQRYYEDPSRDVGKSLVRAVQAANQQIHAQAQADPSKSGMGTTLVAAVVLGRKVYVANVGDSRAYLINKRTMTQITEDHSWVEEQVRAGLLTREQAKRHPQRNLVTRALGSKPAVDVDLFEGAISTGDTLLLCSDGLTGRVEDQEIAAIVRSTPPLQATQALVAAANERGGNDNITVLIVSTERQAAIAPVPAAASGQARAGRSWLIPALVGGVAVVALVLGALWATGILFGSKPTATATPLASGATEVSTTEASPTAETGQTPLPMDSATETAPATGPTSTLQPTSTGQPTATATIPVVVATRSRPTATSTIPKPALSNPDPLAALQGLVRFEWTYSRALGRDQAFQVLIWKQGDPDHQGAAYSRTETWREISLDSVPRLVDGGPGQYLWSVVVVDKDTDDPIGPEAEPRSFTWLGPVGTAAPTSTSKPTPTYTLPPTKALPTLTLTLTLIPPSDTPEPPTNTPEPPTNTPEP